MSVTFLPVLMLLFMLLLQGYSALQSNEISVLLTVMTDSFLPPQSPSTNAVLPPQIDPPQLLRLSFHDAGTYNLAAPSGSGSNGCVCNFNSIFRPFDDGAVNIATTQPCTALQSVRTSFINITKSSLSMADLIQFAGLVAVLSTMTPKDKATYTPLLYNQPVGSIPGFSFGRVDAKICSPSLTDNLPEFFLGGERKSFENDLIRRIDLSGEQIKNKMMLRNGFSAQEAVALIGAHTIGIQRTVFGSSQYSPQSAGIAGPWDETPKTFDNNFFVKLMEVSQNFTRSLIALSDAPDMVDVIYWWQILNTTDIKPTASFLDTDIVMAFRSTNISLYPDFSEFVQEFADDEDFFIEVFLKSLDKMSRLGQPTLPISRNAALSRCSFQFLLLSLVFAYGLIDWVQ